MPLVGRPYQNSPVAQPSRAISGFFLMEIPWMATSTAPWRNCQASYSVIDAHGGVPWNHCQASVVSYRPRQVTSSVYVLSPVRFH